ncbi:hypothetical protein P7K49_003466 [Saguinus oedipus]|uniref:Fringe-like glycosyltransferase domain-containing protein n=1 Tax=Saguinus oedipus TaxID=9490 RepID=A0ABQ9W5E2_SAGOE|nr:hypothetical protein P7K49_003466 [Saguinus oedipus]
MLKRCGRRLLLALAGALLACLLVLTADPPPPSLPAERGRRALRSLAGPAGAALAAPVMGAAGAAGPGALAREVHSLSEYFSLLTRARRDAGPPPGAAPRPADGHPRTLAEPLAPRDVFIAVKTTKKFHRARLDLLLETWISRHKEMVSAPRPGPAGRRGGGPPSGPAGGIVPWGPRCIAIQPLGLSVGGDASAHPCSPVCLLGPLSRYSCVTVPGAPPPVRLQSPRWLQDPMPRERRRAPCVQLRAPWEPPLACWPLRLPGDEGASGPPPASLTDNPFGAPSLGLSPPPPALSLPAV